MIYPTKQTILHCVHKNATRLHYDHVDITALSMTTSSGVDPFNKLFSAYGLQRTYAANWVLGGFLAHPDTSYTHSQLLFVLAKGQQQKLNSVTLYRLLDRLTQGGLLLYRFDTNRVRRFHARSARALAIPDVEFKSRHRNSQLSHALKANDDDLKRVAQNAVDDLTAVGCQGHSIDLAVRRVCADCVIGARH